MTNPFFNSQESDAVEKFLRDGYLIFPVEDKEALARIRKKLTQAAVAVPNIGKIPAEQAFFDRTGEFVPVDRLNTFRMSLIEALARDEEIRPSVFSLARNHIHWIVGNELAMQRNCNLSIQLPADTSSLLPIHCDTWQGNSPFEVVLWLPLTDCYKTRSMYILPRAATEEVVANFDQYSGLSSEELYQRLKDKVVFLDIPLGHALIFSHALLHGNRVNDEKDARWSMNIRFKALFSPFSAKELGESFLPISLRPATRIGSRMKAPKVK